MEIKMNFNQALQAAIMTAIGSEGQELIIKQAVDYLTRPSEYGNKHTPLQNVFFSVADKIAEAVFKDKLENDPAFVAQVESLYVDAIKQVIGTDTRQKTVDKIADAIRKALSERY